MRKRARLKIKDIKIKDWKIKENDRGPKTEDRSKKSSAMRWDRGDGEVSEDDDGSIPFFFNL